MNKKKKENIFKNKKELTSNNIEKKQKDKN
jgi:hypothetical protein